MRRFFGMTKPPNQGKKKRKSPAAVAGGTAQGLAGASQGGKDPGYQYALNEYAQTVAPSTHEDGQQYAGSPDGFVEVDQGAEGGESQVPSSRAPSKVRIQEDTSGTAAKEDEYHYESLADAAEKAAAKVSGLNPHRSEPSQTNQYAYRMRKSFPEANHLDAAYVEWYGDAYLGGPIKYIYPSGYQSMRPRGGPWKLSIAVCLLFTWLSVFIIGHCSDRVDQSLYDQDAIDDDAVAIETRWCGSRLLYLMWVLSMLITGLASAYCSVIGYIKVRDFAVANNRSQSPGFLGKSDFYVQLKDHPPNNDPKESDLSHDYYQHTIYQADGNPQFWGRHIYRPTQAAVNYTSR